MKFDAFRPHRPPLEGKTNDDSLELPAAGTPELKAKIRELHSHPGECIPLADTVGPEALDDDLRVTTIINHLPSGEPTAPISNLRTMSIWSANLDALGERQDSVNRSNDRTTRTEEEFLSFLQTHPDAMICLQDFPVYRLRVLGPRFARMGFSYYANVFGVDGPVPKNASKENPGGHLTALVTLVNQKSGALAGYKVDAPELFAVPHMQGTRKVVDRQERTVNYVQGETPWKETYGLLGRRLSGPHTHQTFVAKCKVHGTDGYKEIVVGNIYISPPSFMVERRESIMESLRAVDALADNNGIPLVIGDTNQYGYDAPVQTLGISSYPTKAGVVGLLRQPNLAEVRSTRQAVERIGFTAAGLGDQPTIVKAGIVGMQLDQVFGKKETKMRPDVLENDFTDHKVLRVEISL